MLVPGSKLIDRAVHDSREPRGQPIGGVVRVALETGAPLVPVGIVGAEEVHPILFKVGTPAQALGLPFLPVTPTFPMLGAAGALPLPSKWVVRVGEPIPIDPDRRYICNPGSVGQPRDADPRASFALLDLEASTFTVHREDYDIASAQAATLQAGLPTVLADRLAIGA